MSATCIIQWTGDRHIILGDVYECDGESNGRYTVPATTAGLLALKYGGEHKLVSGTPEQYRTPTRGDFEHHANLLVRGDLSKLVQRVAALSKDTLAACQARRFDADKVPETERGAAALYLCLRGQPDEAQQLVRAQMVADKAASMAEAADRRR